MDGGITDPRELLKAPIDSFEKPRALPQGHYIGIIDNYAYDRSKKKQTAFVRLTLHPTEATADVRPEDIAGISLPDRELTRDYYITPKAMGLLRIMLEAVLPNTAGRGADQLVPELKGAKVMFGVVQRPDERNATIIYNDVTDIVAAP